MLNAEWVECILDMKDRISGKKFGIAYTASFFGNPKEIWYDRLSTDVPRFVADALRKLDADFIFLSVEDVTSLCELDQSRFDAAPLIAFTATKEIDYGTETDGRIPPGCGAYRADQWAYA